MTGYLLKFLLEYPCVFYVLQKTLYDAFLVTVLCTSLNRNLKEANYCFRKYIHFTNYNLNTLAFIFKWI